MKLVGGSHRGIAGGLASVWCAARRLAVPVGYLDGRDFHFHGAAAWLMVAGFACQAASILVVVSLRLKANPGGKTGQNVAVIVAMVGAFIILAMLFLKMMGLV
ncbi:hypothetical protein ACFSQT_23085 [Mesorhizobium calcicola]|uniref:Uncharacterized protein n=1 Tax=Mesorhizobium calcicola TaxID=1300310 RepID=A0ABW4WGX8_9HYPH